MAKALVALSVVLNVLLGVVLALALRGVLPFDREAPQTARVEAEQPADTAATNAQPARSRADLESYYRELAAQGLSRDETKPLLLARADAEALAMLAAPSDAYWERDNGSLIAYELAASERRDQARAALIAVYGAEAKDDPAFATLFRPMNRRYAFLSSDLQIEAHRRTLQQQLDLLAAASSQSGIGIDAIANPAAVRSAPPDYTWLTELLDNQAEFEYELRDAPLAHQLRRSGVEFTEQEFRESYRILQRLEQLPGQTAFWDARYSLRTLLGDRRFTQLWASRDPTFAAIKQAAEAHQLGDETLLSAYAILNDSQDEMSKVAVTYADADRSRMVRELNRLRVEQQNRLVGLVGEAVAQDIDNARSQQAMRLGQQFLPQREEN